MSLFDRQVKHAARAKELREKLHRFRNGRLRDSFDYRPKENGVTLVSLLEYYPMRGVECRANDDPTNILAKNSGAILSETKTPSYKISLLEQLFDFEEDSRMKEKLEELFEADVQAALIRDFLAHGHWWSQCNEYFKQEYSYLTSELAWSRMVAGCSRPDIVCYSPDGGILIIEVKRGRQTDLSQVLQYKNTLENNWESFSGFVNKLTGSALAPAPDIKTMFVMGHARNSTRDWGKTARNAGVSIFFYETGYTVKQRCG